MAKQPIKWGARIDGEVYGRGDAPWDQASWDLFEAHAGKRVSIIHWGQPFGELDLAAAQLARARAAQSLISVGLDTPAGPIALSDVAAGTYDAKIRAFAGKVAQFGDPLLIRLWWEMNGGWYPWGRHPQFVAAWRRVVDLVRAGASNARFVWCPNAVWDAASDPQPFYPGPGYVDWVGFDAYNRNEPWKTPSQVYDPTLQRLSQFVSPSAPFIICETGCTESGGDKADWIRGALQSWLPKHTRVRAYVWFNWNIYEAGRRRDWQIESSDAATAAFAKGIASSYFRAGG